MSKRDVLKAIKRICGERAETARVALGYEYFDESGFYFKETFRALTVSGETSKREITRWLRTLKEDWANFAIGQKYRPRLTVEGGVQ